MFVQVQALQQRVQRPRPQIVVCLIVNYPVSHFYDLFIVRAFIRYFQPSLPISWLPVGGALLLAYVNKLWAEGTLVACEPAPWVGDAQSSLSICKSDQATFSTANAQSSQCEDPWSRAQLPQGGHEHQQEVNLGCHKSLRNGFVNKPTNGLSDRT